MDEIIANQFVICQISKVFTTEDEEHVEHFMNRD